MMYFIYRISRIVRLERIEALEEMGVGGEWVVADFIHLEVHHRFLPFGIQ